MKLKSVTLILSAFMLVSCAGELTSAEALEQVGAQSELKERFCAPLHLAPEVLTGDNQKDPKPYINSKYGKLIKDGLIEAKLGSSNSWRTILKIELTQKGREFEDKSRTVDDMFYMAVCRVVADSIISLEHRGEDTVLCRYQLRQTEITPFGEFLGYIDGLTLVDERQFVRSTFSWDMVPVE